MKKFKIQDIPKLPGNTILIDSTHFKDLVEYINKQTEIINTLVEKLQTLDKLCENNSITITELKRQIALIADVIGGQMYD